MDFAYSDEVKALQGKLARFMDEHVYPNEHRFRDEVEANRPKASRTSNTRRCAKSWDACTGRRRCSTAPRPTPETWRRWSATVPRSRRGNGSIRCFAERSARLSL